MKTRILVTFLLISACATISRPNRQLASDVKVPDDALTVEQAIKQGPESTLQHLKKMTKAEPLTCAEKLSPDCLPESVRADKSGSSGSSRSGLQPFIRKFHHWKLSRKAKRAEEIKSNFECSHSTESLALALSLERDFPRQQARDLAMDLHEKVSTCDVSHRQESLLRLGIFSIHQSKCPEALGYLNRVEVTPENPVQDRVNYLKSLCTQDLEVTQRNPWGGYGINLGEFNISKPEKPIWYLSAESGSTDWNRFLVSIMDFYEKGQHSKVRYLATKMNYNSFSVLPHSFQASVLVMMHFSGADLNVFQALHRFLAEHPDFATKEVVGLLFPIRYWNEIIANTKETDPILVKSLIRQESAFNPTARSPAKALGLAQVIYPTARIYGIKKRNHLYRPADNIRVCSRFLKRLIDEFGSVELALAAYNAGPDKVREWKKRYPTDNIDLFVEMIPYAETREYVRLVMRNYKVYQTVLLESSVPGIAQHARD